MSSFLGNGAELSRSAAEAMGRSDDPVLRQGVARIHSMYHGMLAPEEAPLDGAVQMLALSAHAISIAGGTNEVQHNIIGERVLGLPKEPSVDRDLPFRQLKVGTQRRHTP